MAATTKSFVALVDPQLLGPKKEAPLQLCRLADPHDGEARWYVVKAQQLAELQALPRDYGSCLVEPHHVVTSRHVHVVSPVDPLFFVVASSLCTGETSLSAQQQWQPLEQLVVGVQAVVSPIVAECLDGAVLQPLLSRLESGDDCYYKLSSTNILAWLQRKQKAVYSVLLQQAETTSRREDESKTKRPSEQNDSGAFDPSFRLADDLQTEARRSSMDPKVALERKRAQTEQRCLHDSVQAVCSYLPPPWCDAFCHHLDLDADTVLLGKQSPAPKQQSSSPTQDGSQSAAVVVSQDDSLLHGSLGHTAKVETKKKVSKSLGVRRLAKVNTSGMKKLTSFFTAPPAAKKKKTQQVAKEEKQATSEPSQTSTAENIVPNKE